MPHGRTVSRRSPHPIRVMVVESRELFAVGVREVLDREPDIEIVALVRWPQEAIILVDEAAPDVILVNAPAAEAASATRQLHIETPGSALVVLGGGDDDPSLVGALELGAAARVGDLAGPDELVDVIRRVADGDDPLSDELRDRPGLLELMLDTIREGMQANLPPVNPLSSRELEILRLVAAGRRNREIAIDLGISAQTVKNHLTSILHKLGVPNRTRAVTYAVRQGWLPLDDATGEDPLAAAGIRPGSTMAAWKC
jgi:two-component system, NarL family, response regulator DegU